MTVWLEACSNSGLWGEGEGGGDLITIRQKRICHRLTSVVVPVPIHCLLELYLEPKRECPCT